VAALARGEIRPSSSFRTKSIWPRSASGIDAV
jgi:hypothetical protein